jgi:hypothetical protein
MPSYTLTLSDTDATALTYLLDAWAPRHPAAPTTPEALLTLLVQAFLGDIRAGVQQALAPLEPVLQTIDAAERVALVQQAKAQAVAPTLRRLEAVPAGQ